VEKNDKYLIMFMLAILSFVFLILIVAFYYIESKIIDDLPDTNGFKRWWRRHLVGDDPEKLK